MNATTTIEGPGTEGVLIGAGGGAVSISISGFTITGFSTGIFVQAGDANIADSTIENNVSTSGAAGRGGVADISTGNVLMTDVTVADNSASGSSLAVGGILDSDGTLALVNSTVSDNTGDTAGGILNGQGTVIATGCTITDNTGGQFGGLETLGTCKVANTIIAGTPTQSQNGIFFDDVGGKLW